jgi:uncharacterized damage-inducible protein DinB
MKGQIDLLLSVIDDAYSGRSWQGPNLRGSIRRLSVEEAAWRPGPDRHNIWELVMHVAYWKYAVKRKLLNEKRGSFPRKGSNWFAHPQDPSEAKWKEDRRLLDEIHQSFRQAIATMDPRILDRNLGGSKFKYVRLVYGAAAHDIYHTGQITLIKRLMPF